MHGQVVATHWKLCWTNINGYLKPFIKKHLGLRNTPNQTAIMVIVFFNHSSTHTLGLLPHAHRTRRSKTQLGQYTCTQVGSSLKSRHAGLWQKGWTIQIPTLSLPKQPSLKYSEKGTQSRRVTISFGQKKGRFILIICKPQHLGQKKGEANSSSSYTAMIHEQHSLAAHQWNVDWNDSLWYYSTSANVNIHVTGK